MPQQGLATALLERYVEVLGGAQGLQNSLLIPSYLWKVGTRERNEARPGSAWDSAWSSSCLAWAAERGEAQGTVTYQKHVSILWTKYL